MSEDYVKACARCGEFKHYSAFRVAPSARDRCSKRCVECITSGEGGTSAEDAAPCSKRCSMCSKMRPLDEFVKDKRKSDGRSSRCKPCQRKLGRAHYNDNTEYYREYRNSDDVRARNLELNRKWRTANPEKNREYRATAKGKAAQARARSKRRAAKAGVPHEPYSRAEIFAAYGNACAYCDAPAEHLDHVVPISKGGADAAYNLLPACADCNLTKSDKSLADWALTWCR